MRKHITLLLILMTLCISAEAQRSHSSKQQRPKVGLVLGGGGAKGAAEVGVLKYIEEAEIPIDYIVGTSIGSIVGGLYSCGYRSADLDTLFRSQQWLTLLTDRNEKLSKRPIWMEDGTQYVFGFPVESPKFIKNIKEKKKERKERKMLAAQDSTLYLETEPETTVKAPKSKKKRVAGLLRGDSIYTFLSSLTNKPEDINFDKLPIPFRCVAVEANSFTEKVFSQGNLAEAMRASMSIPLAFKPVVKDTLTYVDGGMINNLPVDVCKAMGADIIIAIDLTQNHHENDSTYEMAPEKKEKLLKLPRLMKLIAWTKERPDLVKYHENLKLADIYINPNLKGMSATSFTHTKVAAMIQAGEEAGAAVMPQLLELKKRLGKRRK